MVQRTHALEHTKVMKSGVVFHYTCNPPSQAILDRNGIRCIGESLNCLDDREVLLIPSTLYGQYGYRLDDSIRITSENLLTRLS